MLLTSLTVLLFEIVLTRVLSVTMLYHYAFLTISLALLGMSIASVAIFLCGRRLLDRAFQLGADIAKIACAVRGAGDCARLLALHEGRNDVVALGMGPLGGVTRIAAPFLGAPFTYASLLRGRETAPGQLDVQTLESIFEQLQHG